MAENQYAEGKIYKLTLVGKGDGPCYVGSTCTKYLSARLRGHRAHFNHWKAGKRTHVSSFELLEKGEAQITLIELFPTRSLDELRARERYWIERLDCVNKRIPGRTDAEYCADHREELSAKRRAKVECPTCGKEVNRAALPRHKKRKHSGSFSSTEPAAVCVEVASSSAPTEAPPIGPQLC